MMNRFSSILSLAALATALCSMAFIAPPADAQIDRVALMDLYDATNGPNWTNNTNWGSERPIGEWYGVTQSAASGEYAQIIDLRNNNLAGQIPPTWPGRILEGAFRDLVHLILDDNPITGSILPEYGSLGNLVSLSFTNTNLSGSIPSALSELQNLQFLSFFNNSLTGPIPEGIFFIETLQTFQVTFNQLSGPLPSGLGSHDSLVNLRLGYNDFTGPIPSDIASGVSLAHLSLESNQLSGSIPPNIADGPSLQTLHLGGNQLTGPIPPEIGGSTTLLELHLGSNPLSGSIPPELGTLTNLEGLGLAETGMEGTVPESLGNLTQLRSLDLVYNQLTGEVPASIANLQNLEEVYLSGNSFDVLPDLSGISSLFRLYADDNRFEFDDLLPYVGLDDFAYSPQKRYDSPQSISITAGQTTTLDASPQLSPGNQYQWRINGDPIADAGAVQYTIQNAQPADAGVYTLAVTNSLLPALTLLSADIDVSVDGSTLSTDRDALIALYNATDGANWTNSANWLTDEPIAEWYGVTTTSDNETVLYLDLRNNNLTGQLPAAWSDMIPGGALQSMEYLVLSNNSIAGSMPAALGQLASLTTLALDGNQFTGPIPASFGSLDNLFSLNLVGNGISGSIPPELFSLASATHLHLFANQLSGSIPTGLGNNDVIRVLNLSSNNLTGSIPSDIAAGQSIQDLNFNYNALSGSIPPEIGSSSGLRYFQASGNSLTGTIPAELGSLFFLLTLDLSGNELSGSIPAELGNLASLEFMELGGNQLTGAVPATFANLNSLESLYLDLNELEDLPDLSSAPSLSVLAVGSNRFEFDDLEPNTSIQEFTYSPQSPFGSGDTFTLSEGDNLTLSFSAPGSANSYQWVLDSTPIAGATSEQYQISNADAADEGTYQLEVTSSLVPDLVLSSASTIVNVTTGGAEGDFVVTNTNDSGDGSLRAAIAAANANPNEQGFLDEILFNIPGTGPHIIRPQSPLPAITESAGIDGTSQQGATCGATVADHDLRIVLDGSEAGGVEGGLVFRDNENTAFVSGLVINNFSGPGILVDGTPFTSIECNFIGTDASGTTAEPNLHGIRTSNSNNVLIGAGSGEAGNLISGNSEFGLLVDGQAQSGIVIIMGNFIGTDRLGSAAVPNEIGVVVQAGTALIGAPDDVLSNVISGNSVRAIELRGSSSSFLTNNFIGTNVAGTGPVPNGEGILIHDGSAGNTIGIFSDTNDQGYSNLIAYNNGPGVTITGAASTSNRISVNRMFENTGPGIDLGDDGLNLNDIGDNDDGPNRLINSPQIVSSSIDNAGDLIVNYLVESGGQTLRIEFFGADVDGEEGAFFLGADTYFMNEVGQTVQFNLGNANDLGITDPDGIVATSTDNSGNTSEFSGAGSGPGSGQITVTEPTDIDAVSGGDVPLQATLSSGFNATVREVCYRRTGEAEFTCTQLQANGAAFEGVIPSSFVTARGVQYYFRFSDGTTEATVPETDPENSAFVLPVRVTSLRAGGSFAPNTYRMVSIPIELLDGSYADVLDEYGEFDPRRWRLLRWEPTLEDYREYPDLTGGFDPCEAYWLITFDGDDFEIENGESVNPTEPCFVTVRPGWNQFGSPYAFPVAWSDVNVSGAVDGPVAFDASSGDLDPYQYDVEVLQPWQGYWLFNPGTSNVFMSFNPVEAVGKMGKTHDTRRLAGDEYEVRLRASLAEHGLVDTRNRIGLSTQASVGFDDLDFAEAPPIGDHVRLSILENGMRLAGSFRPEDDRGQSWDIQITSDVGGAPASGIVRVSLDEFGLRPEGFGLRLVDLDQGLPVRIDNDGFEVELTGASPVRNLRLIVGTGAYSDEAGGSIPEVPGHAELAQNYPNPFNPSTRIRYQVHIDGPVEIAVFDPLGRRIRTLVDANREPGWYETVWNGRDESGTDVTSGLYFYMLRTTDGSDSRTMVLLR